jgi:formylmethanofuran dehydrogenase subunit E
MSISCDYQGANCALDCDNCRNCGDCNITVKCDCCQEEIYGDFYNLDGEIVCEDCIEDYKTQKEVKRCDHCGQDPEGESVYEIDGQFICESCLDEIYKESEV